MTVVATLPSVRLTDVSVGYEDLPVLENVDLMLLPGSLTAVVGPNGGGKSTLLKLIAGLLRPWSGQAEVFGAAPGAHARSVAYVPQAEVVDWSFPVCAGDVVMMGRYPRLGPVRRPGARDHAAVAEALEQVGMTKFARRQIGALSGGQRRRVFLARALASEPDLYLLDEPVTGVDHATHVDLMTVLDAEARAGRTVIASTHDLAAALHGAQGVYTDVWASMGQEEEAEARRRVFAPFQVNDKLLAQAMPEAVFLHCLPAHRGEEVTDAVLDSPRSVAFDQAENRLHVQKAILLMLLN